MTDYLLSGFFTATKVGKTGLTVTVDVYNSGGTKVVTDGSGVEIGGGVYDYVHSTATPSNYWGIFKTSDTTVDLQHVPSLATRIVTENLDAPISGVAAAVWAVLTSSMTVVGSIGKALAGLLAVFNETVRTLTQTAAQVASVLSGSNLTITNRVTFSATLTGLTIPANWEEIYVTAKSELSDEDSAAVLQWRESNPGVASDGLVRFNGAATTAAFGYLTVDQAGGTVAIVLEDDIDLSNVAGQYHYDVKCVKDDGTTVLLASMAYLVIDLTPTRAV